MNKKLHFAIIVWVVVFITTYSCQIEPVGDLSDGDGNLSKVNVEKSIRLRWMGYWRGEGKKELLLRELARDYSFLNQNIDVELEFPEAIFNVTSDKLYEIQSDSIAKMAIKNEWPFDVLFCDQARYSRVGELLKNPEWGREFLIDFSKEKWYIDAHKEGFFDNSSYVAQYGGIAPGPFIEGSSNILYTSSEVENLLGISVKKYDMNFDDFESYAKAVFQYNQSHAEKLYLFSTQYWNATFILFTQLAMSTYGKKDPASSQEAKEVIQQTYMALERLSAFKPIEQYEKAEPGSRNLFQNKYLFSIWPSWIYILWQMSNPKGVVAMLPAELPSFTDRKSAYYSGNYNVVFVVPQNGKNVEEAKHFIQYMSSAEMSEKWSKYSKCPSALRSNMAYTDLGIDPYSKYYQHIQQKYGNNQLEIDLSKFLFGKSKKMEFKQDDVLAGRLSAAEAYKQLQRQF